MPDKDALYIGGVAFLNLAHRLKPSRGPPCSHVGLAAILPKSFQINYSLRDFVLRLFLSTLLLALLSRPVPVFAQESSSSSAAQPVPAATAPTTPPPVSPEVASAEASIASSDWKTAETKLDSWLAEHPDDARALFDGGQPLIVTVDVRSEEQSLRLTAQRVEPLDKVVAHAAAGLKVFVGAEEALARLKGLFQREAAGGRGRVTVVLDLPHNEVEITLPGGFRVDPRIRAAVKSLPGIVDVHDI